MSDPIPDINATIASAVNARIEAEVLRALSGDETIGRLVSAALQQPIEVSRDGYRKEKVPYLKAVIERALQDATKEAVARLIIEEVDGIEAEVRKALRRDLAAIAGTLTKSLVDAAEKTYGVNVALSVRMPSA